MSLRPSPLNPLPHGWPAHLAHGIACWLTLFAGKLAWQAYAAAGRPPLQILLKCSSNDKKFVIEEAQHTLQVGDCPHAPTLPPAWAAVLRCSAAPLSARCCAPAC